jgi:hypothetical protein
MACCWSDGVAVGGGGVAPIDGVIDMGGAVRCCIRRLVAVARVLRCGCGDGVAVGGGGVAPIDGLIDVGGAVRCSVLVARCAVRSWWRCALLYCDCVAVAAVVIGDRWLVCCRSLRFRASTVVKSNDR